MKKSTSEAITKPDGDRLLAQVVRIGTDIVLSRLPIQRLSRQGAIDITIKNQGTRGCTITKWRVSPSRDFGEPGPLAYDFDTLILNPAIDRMRPNIPRLFKIGNSLNELNDSLGRRSTRNTDQLKNAILQNVGAIVHADIHYKGKDGIERDFEFAASRYSVIFIGEKLPGGQRADAIYILLNELFLEHLLRTKTRPLDLNYLRDLTPAPRRFYELMSSVFFGALSNRRNSRSKSRASYYYSELCTFAPLTRSFNWVVVRNQMNRIHKPHLLSGYISKVEFEETTDGEGRPDWLMWYTPGEKALHEHKEFNEIAREAPRLPEQKRLVAVPTEMNEASEEPAPLISRLIAQGISKKKALELAKKFRVESERQLDALPFRDLSTIRDRSAWLIKAIVEGYTLPPDIEEQRAKAEKRRQAEQKKKRDDARNEHAGKFRPDYFRSYLSPAAEKVLSVESETADALRKALKMWDGYTHRDDVEALKLVTVEDFITEHPELGILTFWQWDARLNPTPFKPAE